MFRRSKTAAVRDSRVLTAALAKDKKFRKQLLDAVVHGVAARRRAERRLGFFPAARRLASDEKLRREVRRMSESLDRAWSRVEKKRRHTLRTTLIVLGVGAGTAAAVKPVRRLLKERGGTTARTIEASVEVDVPLSTAYNQWTQFEDFPLFMEGVDHVHQLDDTRLHWAATVAGKKAEWNAKILEQHPDRQISWISEDGKETRGTVTFEPRGDSKTLIRLSMSYQAEGLTEALGSAAGLDSRRVRGDLDRFKELIENRRDETGAWRGEISAGEKTT
jgi:uncharacterized membrane protein